MRPLPGGRMNCPISLGSPSRFNTVHAGADPDGVERLTSALATPAAFVHNRNWLCCPVSVGSHAEPLFGRNVRFSVFTNISPAPNPAAVRSSDTISRASDGENFTSIGFIR